MAPKGRQVTSSFEKDGQPKTSIIVVPGKLSLAEVKKIVTNPVLSSKDEGDY
jgi:hypothetical protein